MAANTHTAIALLDANKTIGAINVPTRPPASNEVLIKVEFASFAALDGHHVDDNFFVSGYPFILGLVATGVVVEVGSDVEGLKKDDEVGAFTQPGGDRATQQFVTIESHAVAKLPSNIRKQDAAAVIDNFVTAWWTVSSSLGLSLPDSVPFNTIDKSTADTPILVYGAGTSAGLYTIQVLRFAGYSNVIATASPHTAPVAYASGAKHVLDYNDPALTEKVKAAAGSVPIKYAVNPVGTLTSLEQIAKVVDTPGSKVAILLPVKVGQTDLNNGGGKLLTAFPEELSPFAPGVEPVPTSTFFWTQNPNMKANLMTKILPALLESGDIKPHAIHLINEGSLVDRVKTAAELVRGNQLKGAKAIIDFTV